VRSLHSELDAAGHADVLEVLLLLSLDVIAADIELDQRPGLYFPLMSAIIAVVGCCRWF
jgi:hypothetical protein